MAKFKRGDRSVDPELYEEYKNAEHLEALRMLDDGRPTPFVHAGRLYTDDTPLAPPIGFDPKPSLIERIREQVRIQISAQAEADGFESFDDADDFDVPDDPFPAGSSEFHDSNPTVKQLKADLAAAQAQLKKMTNPERPQTVKKQAPDAPPPSPEPEISPQPEK